MYKHTCIYRDKMDVYSIHSQKTSISLARFVVPTTKNTKLSHIQNVEMNVLFASKLE